MKRTLTSIAAASMILGMTVPAAFASTSGPNYNQRTISIGSYSAGLKGIAAKDPWSGANTEFMPIFYLQQGLKALGYTATWNGTTHTLAITTSSGSTTGLTKVTPGNGTVITVNGVPIVNAPKALVAKDPASGKWTSYLPIYYLADALKALGYTSSYNGAAGTWTVASAVKLAVTGAPTSNVAIGQQVSLGVTNNGTAVTSGVTWSSTGGVIDQMGNFVASTAGTYTVTASYDGQTATASIVVYGQTAGFKLSSVPSMVANSQSLETVTVTAVDANGNTVGNYNGTATVGLTAGAATLATGTNQNADLVGSTLTFANGMGKVVLQAGSVPGLTSTLSVTSTSLTDVNGNYLTANETIGSVAQQATSVSVVPVAPDLSANNNGSSNPNDQGTFDVQVLDQAGQPMLTGTYGVTLNLSGPATFTDGTTGPDYISVSGNATVPVTVDALKGQTGTVTLSAASASLTSGTGTMSAVIGQNAAKLAIVPTTAGVTSFTEGPANSLSYTVSATDANGVPSSYNFTNGTVYAYVTNSKGVAAANILVNGTPESTNGVALTSGTLTITDTNGGADAGNYTLTLKDTASTNPLSSPAAVTFTENPGAATQFAITAGAPEVPVGSPSTTETIQVEDNYGNPVAPSTPVTFLVTGTEQTNAGTGYGTATLNGVSATTGVYVKSNATGSATVTFQAQPYDGAVWQVTAAAQAPSALGSQSDTITVNNSVAATATASVVDSSNSNSPTNGAAGDSLKYTFGAKDSLGNLIASTDQFTVTYNAADFQGFVPTGVTTGTDANGNATATGTLTQLNTAFQAVPVTKAGMVSVSITDATIQTSSGIASISINPGPQDVTMYDLFDANGNNVTLNGLKTTANQPMELWLKAVDHYGNPVASTQTTLVTLGDPNGGAFSATSGGAPEYDTKITTGSYGVAVWYVNSLTNTWTSGPSGTPATVQAPTATASSATVVAGQSLTISGSVMDSNGGPLSGQTVKVSFDGVTSTGLTNGNGQYSISITPTMAVSSGTVTVTANGLSTTTTVSVTPANATHLVLSPTTYTATNSSTTNFTVTAEDQYGNVATNVASVSVKLAGNDGGTLSGSAYTAGTGSDEADGTLALTNGTATVTYTAPTTVTSGNTGTLTVSGTGVTSASATISE